MIDQRAWWTAHPGHWIDPWGHVAGTGVGRLVDHWREVVPEHIATKIIEKYGGPGNRTQVPIPACHFIFQLNQRVYLYV